MNGLEDRLNQARSEEDFGTISQGSFWDSHPVLSGLGNMVKELTGIAPSQRLWGQTFGPKSPLRSEMLKPKTPYEMADYAAGVTANTLETALAGVDMAAVAGIKNAAGRTITDLLRGEAGVIGNIKKPGQSLRGTGTELRPAIMVKDTGEVFTGNTHGDAFNKALSEGAITKDTPSENIFSDFFQTKDGELIDRFEASQKYGVTSAEDIQKQSLRGTGAEVQSVSDVYPKPDIHDGSEIPIRPNVEIQTELTPPPTSTAGAFDVERTTRHSWREALSPESQQYVRGVEKNQGKQAIHFNKKTGLSVDFSTSCPKRHSGFGACPYCYVDNDRVAKDLKIGIMTGKPVTDNPYTDEIMKMPADLIWELNKDGGLRMFSFGDFRPGIDDKSVIGLLNDAQARDLHIRAITKQKEFIERFGDHPNLRINISTDPYLPREMSNAPTVQEALQWAGNRGNIKIRAVALNEKQAEKLATDSNIDVVTMYHGFTNFDGKTGVRHDKLWKIVSTQNPDLVKKVGAKRLKAELDTWENMGANSKKFRRVDQKYKGRLCCGGGKCSRDSTKCGFGLGSLGALIMGVHLPMLTEGDDED